ncbi:MAG: hypothetical protein V4590_09295 [Bacteroidota bacterium]
MNHQAHSFHSLHTANLIRESFFLNPESAVTPELIEAFFTAQRTGDFRSVIPHTTGEHSDRFRIHFTHDIDWLHPFHPYSLVNYIRSLFTSRQWLGYNQLFQKDIFLRTINQVLEMEKQAGIKAVYHIGATNGMHLNRYGIRYNQSDALYTELVALLNSYHQHTGLHSSYNADAEQHIHSEKLHLEEYTHKPVLAHRSHFLHSHPDTLYPQLEASGIQYEFGNGLAREVGLTNHFPGKYKPVNLPLQTVLNVTVIPLILVDNVFFVKPYHEVLRSFKDTLQQLKEYNGSACVLFHPENMLLKPQLWNYFEEIIHICKNEGAIVNSSL